MVRLKRCQHCGAVWAVPEWTTCPECRKQDMEELSEEEVGRYVDEGHRTWGVWIPGLAWSHIAEIRHEVEALQGVEAMASRRRGRGSQVLVLATERLAAFLESEAEVWGGWGVDPEATWRVRPCRTAAERIREVLG